VEHSLPKQRKPSSNNTLQQIKTLEDTLTRRNQYAMFLSRKLGRVPTINELMDGYQQDIDDGEVSKHRKSDFNRIIKYLKLTFDNSKCGFVNALERARNTIQQHDITQEMCNEVYGKPSNRTTLTVEDVAFVLALAMTYNGGKTSYVTMTGKYVFAMSQRYKREGKISKTVDVKKFVASKKILTMRGMLLWVGEYRKGQHATQYVVVDAPDALPEPLQSRIEHYEASKVAEEPLTAKDATKCIKPIATKNIDDNQEDIKNGNQDLCNNLQAADGVCGSNIGRLKPSNEQTLGRCG
jgi:hypothetical protein